MAQGRTTFIDKAAWDTVSWLTLSTPQPPHTTSRIDGRTDLLASSLALVYAKRMYFMPGPVSAMPTTTWSGNIRGRGDLCTCCDAKVGEGDRHRFSVTANQRHRVPDHLITTRGHF